MNGFNLNLISKYRAELMGVSTLLILICHAAGNDVLMPKWLMYVVAQAQLGVDIFLFLSGMGLYYSLSIHQGGGKILVCKKIQAYIDSVFGNYDTLWHR